MILLNHHHLYYFWMVAREGSFTRASQKLFLGQPTVSAQIIQLEKFLGKKLFDRSKGKLRLTREGRVVMDYANDIFGLTQDLLNVLRDQPSRESLSVRIGVDPNVSKPVVLQLMKAIYRFKPNAHVSVQEAVAPLLQEGLQTHNFDAILSDQGRIMSGSDEIIRVHVGHPEIYFVATPRFARHIRSFPKDLSSVSLVLPSRSSPLWASVEHFLTHHQVTPHVIAEVGDNYLLRLLALEGLGAAPLPEPSISRDLKAGRLVRLGRGTLGITKRIWLMTRKTQRPNPIAQYLTENFRIKSGD